MKQLRILLVDDHDIVRQGVRRIIEKQDDWQVCGDANNGREALALTEQLQPDVVIIDISMPELNGLDTARQIRRRFSATEVLIFSAANDRESVHAAFEAGAKGYLMKTDIASLLVEAVKSIANHKPFFTPKVSEIVFERYLTEGAGGAPNKVAASALSEREREIVQLLAEGHSNKEVAAKLGISTKTAESHRATIMRKLRIDAFSDLVRYAIRNKIIQA